MSGLEDFFDTFMGYGSGVVDTDHRTLRYMVRGLNFPCEEYLSYWEELSSMFKRLCRTEDDVIPMMGSIRVAFDAAISSLIEPGQKVVVLSNGYWGDYPAAIVRAYEGNPILYKGPLDRPVTGDDAVPVIKEHSDARVVVVLHVETDTGVVNSVEQIGAVVRAHTEALFVVDAATSLGAMDIDLSKWQPDLCFTGSHKAMNGPGGLALVTVNQRVWEEIAARKTPIRSFYTSLVTWRDEWLRPVPNTCYPSVPAIVLHALKSRFDLLFENGPERVFKKHALAGKAIRTGIMGMGLKMVPDCASCEGCDSDRRYCSDVVSVVNYPNSIKKRWAELRPLMKRYRFIADTPGFGKGGGEDRGFRIGHLAAYQIIPRNFMSLVLCLGLCMEELGAKLDIQEGIRRMNEVIKELENIS